MTLDTPRLMRTDWGPGVNGQGAGENRGKNALGELVFDLARADKRGCQEVKVSRLDEAEADRALQAEVLEPAKSGSQYRSSPGSSGSGDKTIMKANCLGSPPVVGED